jgi:hypothetical protein
MDKVLEHIKEYEGVAIRSDPIYRNSDNVLESLKTFIADNGLIIVGGTAIDMALQLCGDGIYPQGWLNDDYDFLSPTNVSHSYELADIFYDLGMDDARAINAQHVKTMRVDIGDNHFLADISFMHIDIFKTIRTLEFNGLKIIHPHMQRIDQHSALAFPYDDAPREVIFARWRKDIKRFNLLNKHYPIEPVGDDVKARARKSMVDLTIHSVLNYPLCGVAAYNAFYQDFISQMTEMGANVSKDIIPGKIEVVSGKKGGDVGDKNTLSIRFNTPIDIIELVSFKSTDEVIQSLELTSVREFDPIAHLIPRTAMGMSGKTRINVYSTANKLLAVNDIKIGNDHVKVVCVQYLLKHFLSSYYAADFKPPYLSPVDKNIYLAYYISTSSMINQYEAALKQKGKTIDPLTDSTPALFPTICTYGNDNISLSRQVALNRLNVELNGGQSLVLPWNYYPGRSREKQIPHPTFDSDTNGFYQEVGKEVS